VKQIHSQPPGITRTDMELPIADMPMITEMARLAPSPNMALKNSAARRRLDERIVSFGTAAKYYGAASGMALDRGANVQQC
jgi:hypothetical protein